MNERGSWEVQGLLAAGTCILYAVGAGVATSQGDYGWAVSFGLLSIVIGNWATLRIR